MRRNRRFKLGGEIEICTGKEVYYPVKAGYELTVREIGTGDVTEVYTYLNNVSKYRVQIFPGATVIMAGKEVVARLSDHLASGLYSVTAERS